MRVSSLCGVWLSRYADKIMMAIRIAAKHTFHAMWLKRINVVETDYRSTDHRYLHLLSVLPFVRTHAVRKGKPHVKFCSQPFYRLRRWSAGGASNSRHAGSGYSVVDKSRGASSEIS